MGVVKGLALVFLSLILIAATVVVLLGFTFNSLLYPETYSDALKSQNAYSIITEQFINTPDNDAGINSQNISELIPPEELERAINSMLSNFLSYIRGDSDELDLTIELDANVILSLFEGFANEIQICNPGEESYSNSFNETFVLCLPQGVDPDLITPELISIIPVCSSDEGMFLGNILQCRPSGITPSELNTYLQNLPPCDDNQDFDISQIPSCRPSDQSNSEFIVEFLLRNNISVAEFSYFNIADEFDQESINFIDTLRSYVNTARIIFYVALSVAVVILITMLLLNYHLAHEFFRWVGADLLFIGLITFSIGIVLKNLVNQLLIRTDLPTGFESDTFSFIFPVMIEIANGLFLRLDILSYSIIGIGVLFIIISFLFTRWDLKAKSLESREKVGKSLKNQSTKVKDEKIAEKPVEIPVETSIKKNVKLESEAKPKTDLGNIRTKKVKISK